MSLDGRFRLTQAALHCALCWLGLQPIRQRKRRERRPKIAGRQLHPFSRLLNRGPSRESTSMLESSKSVQSLEDRRRYVADTLSTLDLQKRISFSFRNKSYIAAANPAAFTFFYRDGESFVSPRSGRPIRIAICSMGRADGGCTAQNPCKRRELNPSRAMHPQFFPLHPARPPLLAGGAGANALERAESTPAALPLGRQARPDLYQVPAGLPARGLG